MGNEYNENFGYSGDKDHLLEKGNIKVVYDDGFKTNILFCSEVKIKNGKFLVIKETSGNRKQIFPIERIIRIQYIGEGKITFE
jgi:hypothetical protein